MQDLIHRHAETWLFWAWLLLLFWAPIPLASNRPWAWAILQAGTFLIAAVWLCLWALRAADFSTASRRAWPIWVVWLLWLLWVGLGAVPLPIAWVETLSPVAVELHRHADATRTMATLSVEPLQTLNKLLMSLFLALTFGLALVLINRRERVKIVGYMLVALGVLIAVYGTLMHLTGASINYFGTLQGHGTSALGTTGSRNIYASYLVLVLALGIGLLLAQLRGTPAENWKDLLRRVLESMFTTKIILRLSLCVLVIALTTTHSRMGNTSFFASLIVAGLIGLLLSRQAPRGTVLLLSSLVVIDLLIVGSWFGAERLAERIEQTTTAEFHARQNPTGFVFSQINDYPVFGSGLGTYYAIFYKYRTEHHVAFHDYAHNDYMQFSAETGWIGLGLVGLLVLLSFLAALRAQWERRDPLMRGIAFACIMAIIALMIHSWVDFNLQIPANAMYFMVLLALGWISLYLDRRPRGKRNG